MGLSKEYRRVLRLALAQGWRVEDRGGDRYILFAPEPSCESVTVHGSESDHRAYLNTRARLRRAGLIGL